MVEYYMQIVNQIIIMILLLSIISLVINFKKKIKEDRMRLDQSKSLDEVISLLDGFITSEFDNYKIMNLEHKDFEYINRQFENEIINDVMNIVMSRLSVNILYTLSLYYDKTAINDIIAEKVYFIVTIYVYNINTTKSRAEIEQERRKKNM